VPWQLPLGQGSRSAARFAAADNNNPTATMLLRLVGGLEDICRDGEASYLAGSRRHLTPG